ncbi:Hsp20/alpha crystallin family protein [Bacillus sp. OK048]|uniref:Hsp20/alpha crystallin family protein n=1 Tax=Bacillus sp. OK048 TaxID=1882761 RepID=UPI0008845B8B|nr:Hsp20/alpha crystallin family protein [Bacillus sp. OK048]SDL93530.1 heat shock protein Hsp20 [Bacillus sp. OK048]
MSSMIPSDENNNKKVKPEHFKDFFRSMNDLIHEKPVKGFLQSMDEFFNNPFPSGGFPVQVRDLEDETIISAELPGIKKERIRLNILPNQLTITIENHEVEAKEDLNNHFFHKKVSQQRLSRTISLPMVINERLVKASYRDGLLTIRIPLIKGKTINIED